MKDNFLKSLTGLGSDKKKTGGAAEAEAAQEGARADEEAIQIQRDILAVLKGAHGAAAGADKKQGGQHASGAGHKISRSFCPEYRSGCSCSKPGTSFVTLATLQQHQTNQQCSDYYVTNQHQCLNRIHQSA